MITKAEITHSTSINEYGGMDVCASLVIRRKAYINPDGNQTVQYIDQLQDKLDSEIFELLYGPEFNKSRFA